MIFNITNYKKEQKIHYKKALYLSCKILALLHGSREKHIESKFLSSIETNSGIGWDSSVKAIFNKVVAGLSKLIYPFHGHLAVINSTIMQPNDHISAAAPSDSWRATSGAIQGMLPYKTL